VTCGQIEAWRPVRANRWVMEERRFVSLLERLGELVTACQAAVALPGGPGTLAEVALSWNLNIIQPQDPKPLVLVGAGWQHLMDEFVLRFDATIPPAQRGLLRFAGDVHQAVLMLDQGGQQAGRDHSPVMERNALTY
jgi:predicted Rossmann-fold nucleotide-binding protein